MTDRADLLRRLEVIEGRDGLSDSRWYRNPDGPEAAGALREADAEIARLRDALTPSAETKAAYIGEVRCTIRIWDEFGEERDVTTDVPWTAMKDFMKLIRANVALSRPEKDRTDG